MNVIKRILSKIINYLFYNKIQFILIYVTHNNMRVNPLKFQFIECSEIMTVKALYDLAEFILFSKLGTELFFECLGEIIPQRLLIGILCKLCRCILKALGYFLKSRSLKIYISDIKNPF